MLHFIIGSEYRKQEEGWREVDRETFKSRRHDEMSEERETVKTDWEVDKTDRQDKMKEQGNAKMMDQEVIERRMQGEIRKEKAKMNHTKSSGSFGTNDEQLSVGRQTKGAAIGCTMYSSVRCFYRQ